ncbi:MAG: cytochrome P450 [Polyangiaceae bacterium]|nr:cytochrome P450 [Polyangiaceae bacterium]
MLDFDPFSLDFHADPYPTYKILRDDYPLYHNERLNFWALSRYEDVVKASLDWETYSSAGGTSLEFPPSVVKMLPPYIIYMDPPRQVRLRKLVSKGFTPRRVASLEEGIRETARDLLKPLVARGSFDFVKEFASVLPMAVIGKLIGFPDSDLDMIREKSADMLTRTPGSSEIPPEAAKAGYKLLKYYLNFVQEARKNPPDNVLGALLEAEVADDAGGQLEKLTDDELVAFAMLFGTAGAETAVKLLGNLCALFQEEPDVLQRIMADTSLLKSATEEALRLLPPSQYQGRTLTRDVTMYGKTMREGDRVILLTGAACRDEREYENPDKFDIDRSIPISLAFGHGIHKCLGAPLARNEVRICFEEFFKLVSSYKIDHDKTERVFMSNVHGYSGIPISF